MAYYTVTVRDLIGNGFDFGLKDYPIYDESYRTELNNKILNHYLMREIGQETPELFKIMLNNTMNEIMPKYNLLYQALEEFKEQDNLLGNINLKKITDYEGIDSIVNSGYDRDVNGYEKDGDVSTGTHLFQDTPQGELDRTEIDNQTWATNLTQDKQVNKSDSFVKREKNTQAVNDKSGKTVEVTTGNTGNIYSVEVLRKIAGAKINIDLQIINDLNCLFMGLY